MKKPIRNLADLEEIRAIIGESCYGQLWPLVEKAGEDPGCSYKLVFQEGDGWRVNVRITPKGDPKEKVARPCVVKVVAEFTLGGQNFDAVSVELTEVEPGREWMRPETWEAISAADADGRAVRTGEAWNHVQRHDRKLPADLKRYCLVSARPEPGRAHAVSLIATETFFAEWFANSRSLSSLFDHGDLILRHREG